MFELNQVSVSVAEKCLLQPSTLKFRAGKVYGLIGHNGSGKSTLLKVLAGQVIPDKGQACFKGKAIALWKTKAYAREVAYLPQNPAETGVLTVQELVQFGRYPWLGLLGRAGKQDGIQVEKAMMLTQTLKFRHEHVSSLSGGEKQRVWMAMLLAQQSQFLLLDEPLAALDVAYQVETMGLIQDLSQSLGIGVVIILHDVNLAARYCDQVIALHSGRVLVQGTPTDLMTEENLRAIYGVDMSLLAHPTQNIPVAVVGG